jgi:hypothetical protein
MPIPNPPLQDFYLTPTTTSTLSLFPPDVLTTPRNKYAPSDTGRSFASRKSHEPTGRGVSPRYITRAEIAHLIFNATYGIAGGITIIATR